MNARWLDKDGDWRIRGKECVIWINRRPQYCDRGNFLAHLECWGRLHLDIDDQDGWPRYYFDLERAKLEIEAWLHKRGQWLGARKYHVRYQPKKKPV